MVKRNSSIKKGYKISLSLININSSPKMFFLYTYAFDMCTHPNKYHGSCLVHSAILKFYSGNFFHNPYFFTVSIFLYFNMASERFYVCRRASFSNFFHNIFIHTLLPVILIYSTCTTLPLKIISIG